jgi:hypothetical protein
MNVDIAKLNVYIGQFVGDLGAALHAGMVVIGEKLGLNKALAGQPMTSAQLASSTGTDKRYVREWLASQAAGGYVSYDARASIAQRRWNVDDRGTIRQRRIERQPQSCWPSPLFLFHAVVHAVFTLARSGALSRSTIGGKAHARRGHIRWLQPIPARHGNPIQHCYEARP